MGNQQKTDTSGRMDQMGKDRQTGTHGVDPATQKGGWDDQATWKDQSQQQRDMRQGDATKPAQPSGTTPLERDQQPVRKER